jgi:phosphate starvation-inducible PhoH-like protein
MASKKAISIQSVLNKYQLNQEQINAVEAIKNKKIVVLTGVAGSAKSFTAVYSALKLLSDGKASKIALTRPMVTTEKMGALPGTEQEKYLPYLYPLVEFFNKLGDAGNGTFESMLESEKIRINPLAFMRGQTIEDEVLIFDEAQNSTMEQMLMVLTRIGENGRIIITGDEEQSDLSDKNPSGIIGAIKLAERMRNVVHIKMTQNMRDPMINEIIENWKKIKNDLLTEF